MVIIPAMEAWPSIPDDVVTWFRDTFAQANRRVCERLVNVPNIRETSLDDGLIEALIPETAPTLLPSGAIVRMDTHNIGGLRGLGSHWRLEPPHLRRWETADIAVLVFVYKRETLIAKKIGLLQSKRLFPANNDVDEDDDVALLHGMNAFLRRGDEPQTLAVLHRTFRFDENCIYGALRFGSDQTHRIDTLNNEFGKALYYLLYNPHILPISIEYPLSQRIRVGDAPVGCRVCDAEQIHRAVSGGVSPTYGSVQACADQWPLEIWAADLLLTCRVGRQFDESDDERVHYFLERRSGPIGAALAVTITLA